MFYISNRYGVYVVVYLGRSVYIRPGVVLGTNNYPREIDIQMEDVQELLINRYNGYFLSLNYQLTPNFLVSFGGSYLTRDVNSPSPVDDRFTVNFGLTTEF